MIQFYKGCASSFFQKSNNASTQRNFGLVISPFSFFLSPSFNTTLYCQETTNQNYIFESYGSMKPHPDKFEKGGEDAFCISNNNKVIGVADGVGGYIEQGIDPGLFATSLMDELKKTADTTHKTDPIDLLTNAYQVASTIEGGATVCVISLEENILQTANLGDSGFRIVRDGQIIYASQEQQYAFNTPYQIPGNQISDCSVDNITIQEGDLILCATDGIFDNIFDEHLLEITKQNLNTENGKYDLQRIVTQILEKSHEFGNSETENTPWAVKGSIYGIKGGKLDDSTVVVSQIVKDEQEKIQKEA